MARRYTQEELPNLINAPKFIDCCYEAADLRVESGRSGIHPDYGAANLRKVGYNLYQIQEALSGTDIIFNFRDTQSVEDFINFVQGRGNLNWDKGRNLKVKVMRFLPPDGQKEKALREFAKTGDTPMLKHRANFKSRGGGLASEPRRH